MMGDSTGVQPAPFLVTDEDRAILSMTDDEYKPLSWDYIKSVIGSVIN